MAVPVATALLTGAHMVAYPYSSLPKAITLEGSGTNTPTGWEWSLVPTDANVKGGLPAGSALLAGVHGDFTNGKSTTQNPSITLDVPGGYCFTLRAQNGDGWSKPTARGDGTSCQCIVYVLTESGLYLPPENEFGYAQDLNATLAIIDAELVSISIPVLCEDELVAVGAETTLELTRMPVVARSNRSGYDLEVFKNGLMCRYVAGEPGEGYEFTYDPGTNTVGFFLAAGSDWWLARYRTIDA